MSRVYVTPSHLRQLSEWLTDSERAVLADVAAAGVLSALQLQRLHAEPSLSGTRSFRRTLSRLAEAGLLCRLSRRVGGRKAGSTSFVYALDIPGQRLLTPLEGGQRYRRPWTPGPSVLGHALAVSEVYVRLRLAAQAGQLQLVQWQGEPACWRPFTSAGGPSVLKPDAAVVLGLGAWEDRWFIEIDCGTEGPATLARKLAAYGSYLASGREQQAEGVFPGVLWLVPDTERQRVLQRAIARSDGEAVHRTALQATVPGVFSEEPP